jgi:hypothetical protein
MPAAAESASAAETPRPAEVDPAKLARALFDACTDCIMFDIAVMSHLELDSLYALSRTSRKWRAAVEFYASCARYFDHRKTKVVGDVTLLFDGKSYRRHADSPNNHVRRMQKSRDVFLRTLLHRANVIAVREEPVAHAVRGGGTREPIYPMLYQTGRGPHAAIFRELARNGLVDVDSDPSPGRHALQRSIRAQTQRSEQWRLVPRMATDVHRSPSLMRKIKTYCHYELVHVGSMASARMEELKGGSAFDCGRYVVSCAKSAVRNGGKLGGERGWDDSASGAALSGVPIRVDASGMHVSASDIDDDALDTLHHHACLAAYGFVDRSTHAKRVMHPFCLPWAVNRATGHIQQFKPVGNVGVATYWGGSDYWQRVIDRLRRKNDDEDALTRQTRALLERIDPRAAVPPCWWEHVFTRGDWVDAACRECLTKFHHALGRSSRVPVWHNPSAGDLFLASPPQPPAVATVRTHLCHYMQHLRHLEFHQVRFASCYGLGALDFLLDGNGAGPVSPRLAKLSFVRCSNAAIAPRNFEKLKRSAAPDANAQPLFRALEDLCISGCTLTEEGTPEKERQAFAEMADFLARHTSTELSTLTLRNMPCIRDDSGLTKLLRSTGAVITIDLAGCGGIRGDFLIHKPDLGSPLSVVRCSMMQSAAESEVNEFWAQKNDKSRLWPTVFELNISGCHALYERLFGRESSDVPLDCIAFPGYLSFLSASHMAPNDSTGAMSHKMFTTIANSCSDTLKMLDLSHNDHTLTDQNVSIVASSCKQLTDLVLNSCKMLTNRTLVAVAANLKNLDHLGMCDNPNITGEGIVSALVMGRARSRWLDWPQLSERLHQYQATARERVPDGGKKLPPAAEPWETALFPLPRLNFVTLRGCDAALVNKLQVKEYMLMLPKTRRGTVLL